MESQSDYHVRTYGNPLTTAQYEDGVVTLAPAPAVHHTTHHHTHTTHVAQIIPPQV